MPLRTKTDRLNRVIAKCRADGYLVECLTPGGRRLYSLMAGMSSSLPDELRALLGGWCPISVSECICAARTVGAGATTSA